MSETPRTDEQVFPRGAYGQSAVSADFARQLERELAALEAENAALKKTIAVIPLVRDAWTPDEQLKLESRVAELEKLSALETCPRCGVRFLAEKTVDTKSAEA